MQSNKKPSVDVIIPAWHESPRLLTRAIDSALQQEGVVVRVIVVFDQLCPDALANAGPDVRMLCTGRDGSGPASARNLALDNSQSQQVAFLDSDDYFLPGRLARLCPMAAEHGAAFGSLRMTPVDADFRPRGEARFSCAGDTSGLHDLQFFMRAIEGPIPCVATRQALGGLRFPPYRSYEDTAFNYALIQACGGAAWWDAAPLYCYSVREHSLSHGDGIAQLAEQALRGIRADIAGGRYPGGPDVLAFFTELQARNQIYNRYLDQGGTLSYCDYYWLSGFECGFGLLRSSKAGAGHSRSG